MPRKPEPLFTASQVREIERRRKSLQDAPGDVARRVANAGTTKALRTLQRAFQRACYPQNARCKVMDLGCVLEELRDHLEAQFADGMTWENQDEVWVPDLSVDPSLFDHRDEEERNRCWNIRNVVARRLV